MVPRPSSRHDFRFAIICALPLEYDAVYDSFDGIWADQDGGFGKVTGDPNRYTIGRVGTLPVVLVLLPGMGRVDAASATRSLCISYSNLTVAFLVGICGAVPHLFGGTEILLGDVIVSRYVVRYDFGREYPDGFKPKKTIEDTLGRPNKAVRVLNALLDTRSSRDELEGNALILLKQLQAKLANTKHRGIYDYLGTAHDQLFEAKYRHKHQDAAACDICSTCLAAVDPVCDNALESNCANLKCSGVELVDRDRLKERQQEEQQGINVAPTLAVHTGGIGSADTVMKSGELRDRIAKTDGVIAFEMEGAGVWDEMPCIIVKGVSDYADSHKQQDWQKYAAATAASTAKAILISYFEAGPVEGNSRDLPCYHIPNVINTSFVGRSEVIAKLMENLFLQPDTRRVALFGLGGMGKTQVALQIVSRTKKNYPDFSIFWAPAANNANYEQACNEIMTALAIQKAGDDDAKLSVQRFLSSSKAGKWLLIVDNADDEEIVFGSSDNPKGLNEYFPNSPYGRTLFTSRYRKMAVQLARRDILELKELAPAEGVQFLLSSIITQEEVENRETALQLLEELTYLPLAITQAVAYINTINITIAEYLQLFRNTDQDQIELLSSKFHDDTQHKEEENTITKTWLISFCQIRKTDESAATLLCFIAHIEPKAIPRSILPKIGSEQKTTAALGSLCGYGFLEKRRGGMIFDMHNLVHIATRLWHQKSNMQLTWSCVVGHLATIFPTDNWDNRELWRQYLPHALRALDGDSDEKGEQYCELGYLVSRCLQVDGRTREAVQLLELLVAIREKTLAEDHPSRLASQHLLARVYRANGQVKKAVKLLEHVVAIEETTFSEEKPSRLASQHQLAVIYRDNGRIKEAVKILEHVVAIREKTLAEGHPSQLASQHQLAGAYRANGEVKEAVKLLEHVVSMKQETLAEDHPSRLASQHQLAIAYRVNGQVKESVKLLEHVVRLRTGTAEDHPDRLASQHQLARAYRADGQVKKATNLLESVVKIREQILAEDHPSRLASQHQLAIVYRDNGQVQKGAKLLEHVVAIQEKTLAEGHPSRFASEALFQEMKQHLNDRPW